MNIGTNKHDNLKQQLRIETRIIPHNTGSNLIKFTVQQLQINDIQ